MVPLALCDDETSDEEMADIVIGMLDAGRPQQFAPGKPVMKTHLLDSQPVEEIQLHDFVGERSNAWMLQLAGCSHPHKFGCSLHHSLGSRKWFTL